MKTTAVIIIVAATIASTGIAAAKEYIYGSGVSARHAIHPSAIEPYFAAVKKDTFDAVEWRLVANAQIVSERSALEGVRDRLVDAALVIPVFHRKELSAHNLLFDMQVFGTDTVAVTGALIETLMRECPQCLEQYRNQNALFLGAYSITQFRMFCRRPINSLAEVAGKKVRATGGSIRWVTAMGGVPISLPPTDAVPAFQSGSLDCVLASYSWLNSFGYMDLTSWIVDFPMGNPRGIAFMAINRDTWRSFTSAQRKVMVDHMPLAVARSTIVGHIEDDEKALKQARERGITIFKGGEDFARRMTAYRDEERKSIATSMKDLGVREPEALMNKFLDLYGVWEKLSAEMKDDVGKFAAALSERVYSKLAPDNL